MEAHFSNSGLDSRYPLYRGAALALPQGLRTVPDVQAALQSATAGKQPGAVVTRSADGFEAYRLLARGNKGEKLWHAGLYAPLRAGAPSYIAIGQEAAALVDGESLFKL